MTYYPPPEVEEYYRELQLEVAAECREQDAVARRVTLHYFVSKSKGWRNGKRRLRRNWKEVRLVNYCAGFHLWHRCPFDEWASEIIGEWADGEMLKERIMGLI